MNNRRFFLLLLSLLFAAPCAFSQQEVQLSQYMFNGLTLNPALAGSHEALNVQLLYRRQWAGIDKGPQSEIGSIDGTLTKDNSMGWGISVIGDQIGLMNTLGAYASYSYRMQLNELGDRLSFGLSAGAMQQAFKGVNSSLTGNQGSNIYDDGDDVLASEKRWTPEFRAGAYYSMGSLMYAGLSVSNLGSLIDSIKNPYIYFNLGANYPFGTKWTLSPSLMMTCPVHDRASLDLNLALTYAERFWFGAGYRMALPINDATGTNARNAIALMAELWITPSLRLGYCYDYTVGRLNGVQNGSHEVSLGFTLGRKVSKFKSPRDVSSVQ